MNSMISLSMSYFFFCIMWYLKYYIYFEMYFFIHIILIYLCIYVVFILFLVSYIFYYVLIIFFIIFISYNHIVSKIIKSNFTMLFTTLSLYIQDGDGNWHVAAIATIVDTIGSLAIYSATDCAKVTTDYNISYYSSAKIQVSLIFYNL